MECALCGNYTRFDLVASSSQIRFMCFGKQKLILRCKDCGLVALHPPWSREEVDEIYKRYLNHEKDFIGQKRGKTVSKYLRKHCKKNHIILEIGSGRGDNVKYLNSLGYNVIGIDKDPYYCDGDKLIYSDYKDYSGKFDFIYAIQVFEHIEEPVDFINKIRSMLNPGGNFLIEVPNFEDPLLCLYKIESFKKFYYYPYHAFFYTYDTIGKMFSKAGVSVKIKRYQRYGIINHLRWAVLDRPANWNPEIPILDRIYKLFLEKNKKVSDTLIVTGGGNG